MVDEDSHSTDVSVSGQKVIQQLYWLITCFDFNWGKSCLATLITKIALKCLEFLLLLYNMHILASDQKKVFVFSSNFWATFWKIKGNILKNLEQLVASLLIPSFHVLSGYFYVSLVWWPRFPQFEFRDHYIFLWNCPPTPPLSQH